jgi:hypothetical protein
MPNKANAVKPAIAYRFQFQARWRGFTDSRRSGMTAKRAAVVGTCLGLGLVCLLPVWALGTAPKKRPGALCVTFAGWTNASGGILAQFDVANSFGRRVQFGVGELQFRETNGWPPPAMLGVGTGDWLSIEPGSHLVFSVPAPSLEEPTWRVPLIYEEDPPLIIDFLDRIRGVDFGSVHWSLRARRKHRASFVVGPEMVRLSKSVQGTGAGRSTQETNRTSLAVGFRR